MIAMHRKARQAARRIVSMVTGDGLAQEPTACAEGSATAPELASLARQAAAEGCVLLANDATLPLAPEEEVAVFGRCQLDWFFMGYGSGGDVHPPYAANLLDGLDAVGASYNGVLAEVYRAWTTDDAHRADQGFWGHWPTHRPEMPVSAELARAAARTARTAIVVLGRAAGEGMDLPLAPGGYYLTNAEHALLGTVTATFERTVVVLNAGNVFDLAWTRAYGRRISAVLLAWQGGMEAGNAVADVLYGRTNPCGCLAASVARSYAAYPGSATFGNPRRVSYDEGVFVGYRHFATHAPEDVLYAFGHGLSYTSFATELVSCGPFGQDGGLVATARVTNVGGRAGRKVVQLWCEPPAGTIQKPSRVLAAFAKTAVLGPGQSEVVSLAVGARSVASYDEGRAAFVLEAGTYAFLVGDVMRTDEGSGPLEVALGEPVVVERCSPLCKTSEELRERIAAGLRDARRKEVADSADPIVGQLGDDDLRALVCGEGLMNSTLGPRGNAGALGGVTPSLRERGIPPVICADGPSGLRLGRRCSLLPSATTLACTWDTDLVRRLYALVGAEVRDAGVDVLLAPAMNIQRNPLCGRNFEYFSEDPLVTGLMAAAVVEGLQGAGVHACPKHFACNNQELRRNVCDSRVDERTLREIYLRGFQTCVRKARPHLVMTSYNKVNGVWSHYHFDLVTTILRGEWGFDGVVITDWWMRPARSPEFPELRNNAYRVRAGVDVLMPGTPKRVAGIGRDELERTARRVVGLARSRP